MFSETLKHITKGLFVVLAIIGLAFAFQAPSYAACLPGCTNNAVCAQRFDTCPNYELGDSAVLQVTTNPMQAGQVVTRDRTFTPESGATQITSGVQIGTTQSNGTFTNFVPLSINDVSLVGRYRDTYYVGGIRGNTISFEVKAPVGGGPFDPGID